MITVVNEKSSLLDRIIVRGNKFEEGIIKKPYNSIFFGDHFFHTQLINLLVFLKSHNIQEITIASPREPNNIINSEFISYKLNLVEMNFSEIKNITDLISKIEGHEDNELFFNVINGGFTHTFLFDNEAEFLFYLNKDVESLLFSTKSQKLFLLLMEKDFIFYDIKGRVSNIVTGKDECWIADEKCLTSNSASFPYWMEGVSELLLQRENYIQHDKLCDFWRKICTNYQWNNWK